MAKRIRSTENMVIIYASRAPGYIVHPRRKEPTLLSNERKVALANIFGHQNESRKKSASKGQKRRKTRSSTNKWENETTEFIADGKAINAVHYKPPDNREAQIKLPEQVGDATPGMKTNFGRRGICIRLLRPVPH